MTKQARTDGAIAKLNLRIEDLDHDICWLIQHGHEEFPYIEVVVQLDKLAKLRRRWANSVERLLKRG